jgi:hypothetical protein
VRGGGFVPDILSQGGDREPRWCPRQVAAVAVLVLVAVLVVEYPSHRHSTARPHQAAVTGTPAPLAVPGAAAPAPGLAYKPDGVIGRTLPWPGSLRLPVTGERPAWFWPATGRMRPIGGLPRERSGYVFTRVGGGWAVQPGSAARPGCGSRAGPSLPVYFLRDAAGSATRVGTADQVAPAATAGALWLTSYPPGADVNTAAGTARQVSVGGAPAGPPIRLPAGYTICQATDRGLLLAPVILRPGAISGKLWEPADPRARRGFDRVIAASPGEIAWATRCAPLCQVHVLDLATGRGTLIELPGTSSVANAAFSPDGHCLALEVSFFNDANDSALATGLDVAQVASGHLTVLPQTWASGDALAGFGWPAGDGTLVAELSFTTRLEVTSWRPGATRLAVAFIRPRQNPATLIVG